MTSRIFSLRIAVSLRDSAERLARSDGVSLNHFINTAIAEKLARDETASLFAARALRGTREALVDFLNAAPNQAPFFDTDEVATDLRTQLQERS